MARDAPVTVNNVTPADTALFGQYPGGLLDYKYLTSNSAGETNTATAMQCLAVPLNASRMIRVVGWGLIKLDATGVAAGNGVQIRLQQDAVDLIREDYAVWHTTPTLNAALEGRYKFRIEWTFATSGAVTSDFGLIYGVSGSGGSAQVLGVASPAFLGVYDDAPTVTST